MWFQVSKDDKKFYQASYFVHEKSTHKDKCIELVGNLSRIKLSSMDNNITLASI